MTTVLLHQSERSLQEHLEAMGPERRHAAFEGGELSLAELNVWAALCLTLADLD